MRLISCRQFEMERKDDCYKASLKDVRAILKNEKAAETRKQAKSTKEENEGSQPRRNKCTVYYDGVKQKPQKRKAENQNPSGSHKQFVGRSQSCPPPLDGNKY